MHLFIIPLVVMIITQALKLFIEAARGNFSWSHLTGYGGMPSSHSAIVVSLSTTLGYYEGFASPAFAVSIILLSLVLRDAAGLRFQLGVHGHIINKLIKELPEREEYKFPVLTERLGHTLLEVSAGGVVGLILTVLMITAWPR